ncbi:ABC transporter permease [Lactiplantibacillus plantarum]|uniref:ABC transporter permease n=1 Tax=Lactiplantibacillus plantarum TaxID=1590 RepID=UPI003EE7257F
MKMNFQNTKIAFQVEIQKLFKSHLIWMVAGGFFILLLIKQATTWKEYSDNVLYLYSSLIGLVGFGVISSWIFAREYQDGVFKDLLALPISRMTIIIAKMMAVTVATVLILGLCVLISCVMSLVLWHTSTSWSALWLLTRELLALTLLNLPLAFLWPCLASLWRNAIFPMSLSFMTVIISVIFAAKPLGRFIPWSIPGFYLANNEKLSYLSTVILVSVGVIGILGTTFIWICMDQK